MTLLTNNGCKVKVKWFKVKAFDTRSIDRAVIEAGELPKPVLLDLLC
jgi:hypothetical protein